NLVITRVFPSGKAQKWNLEPYWTKVEISNPRINHYNLILKSKEKVVMIGSFLNYYDKKRLMKKIEDALQNYKISYRV
ncbi:MAG: hypothetical protein CMM99_04260, partial [Rickettsiales bacterium]|nr:hypothetical protein [Rickettsiales bacterium]